MWWGGGGGWGAGRPAASTAAPASACRSAARSRACSAASCRCARRPGEGSTFTLFVPLEAAAIAAPGGEATPARYENSGAIVADRAAGRLEVSDDRDNLGDDPFVLIVEDDVTFASILLDLAREAGLKGVVSTAGAGTLAMARKLQPDAITLDLGLDDIDGFVLLDLLEARSRDQPIPIHVISGADEAASALGMGALRRHRQAGRPRRARRAVPRIAAQAKRGEQQAGQARRRPRRRPARPRQLPELAGAKVLIVDDDIRNIYSLTSVLESYDVEVLHAERGQDGILILEQTPGIDVALIDIMMPEMDGYETMQQIRERPELADLPLIAVTAKAMKGDRQKCLDAGASDYIAKPVDIELLLALLRVWIGRVREARGRCRRAASPRRRRNKRMNGPWEKSRSRGARRRSRSRPRRAERARVLVVDDDERNLLAIRTVLEDLAEVEVAALGRRGAAPPAQGRVRGDPARRLHARHGRLRDRPDHPQPRADQAHPDRLPVGGQQGNRASDARLFDGRGRLCVQAGRAGRAALEGRGVRRSLREDAGDRAQGAAGAGAARRQPRANAERLRVEQELRRAEQRQAAIIQSLPMVLYLEPYDAKPRAPELRQRRLQSDHRLHCSKTSPSSRTSGWSGFIPRIAIGCIAALEARRKSGRSSIEYRWQCADGSYKHFLDQAVLLQDGEGTPGRISPAR